MELMAHYWDQLLQMGRSHGVDPMTFGLLYIIHVPLFWGTMAIAVYRARLRQPYLAFVALDAVWLLIPYGYVFLFGHGLPWWIYAVVGLCLAFGGYHAVNEFRRRHRSPS